MEKFTTGGKVRAYIVQRKEADETITEWENLWTEIGKTCEIRNQPEGKLFEYRVRALNTAGIGPASNILTLKF